MLAPCWTQLQKRLNGVGGSPVLAPARVDLALAGADLVAAREALHAWRPSPGDLRGAVRRLLSEFLVLRVDGDHRAAEAALTQAVAAARGERLRWPFLEVPSALRAVRRGVGQSSWLTDDALWEIAVRLQLGLRAQEALLEPLSDRELVVLAHLPSRMRNQDIAAELFVSVNTVKTHLANIYRKLGVTERDEAIARAQQLDLL